MSGRFFTSCLGVLVVTCMTCCGVVSAAEPAEKPHSGGDEWRAIVGPLIGTILAEPANFSLALLGSEQIQKELRLNDEQQAKLKALREQVAAEIRKGLGDLRNLTPEQQRIKVAELRAKIKKESQSIHGAVSRLLDRDQGERLRQIVIQVRGVASLSEKEVSQPLKLTESQQNQLHAIRDEVRDKIHSVFRGFRDASPEERRRRMEGMRKEIGAVERDAMKRASEILTPEQRSAFTKIQGAKFELDLAKLVPRRPIVAERTPGRPPDRKDGPTQDR